MIFGLPSGDAIRLGGDHNTDCYNNIIISEGWKKVSEQYLRSFGPYEVEDATVPYLDARQAYFTRPEINEEDNVFRSPADFYPVHPGIIDLANASNVGNCAVDQDFFAKPRPVANCASDHGAVELDYPVMTPPCVGLKNQQQAMERKNRPRFTPCQRGSGNTRIEKILLQP